MYDAARMPAAPARLQWRIFTVLWLLGMPGMSAMVWSIVPHWRRVQPLTPAFGQPGVEMLLVLSSVLALAVAVGVLFAPRVGLAAPILTSWVAGRSPREALRRVWLPGVSGGVAGAAWLVTLAIVWPESVKAAEPLYTMPLAAKLLYGSVTNELLVRWGMLSCVFWGVWRLSGRRDAPPSTALGWTAIVLCSLLWAATHWLLAWLLLGPLPVLLLLHVLLGKVVYGLMAGFLFWRYGLEAAILAHLLTYLMSHGLIGPVL